MAALSIVLFAPAAFADEDAPPPLPPPTAPAAAPATAPAAPTTTVQAAPGTGGLTVVAPLAGGGTVTAVGCSSVVVGNHSTEVRPGDPCPAPQVHQAPPPPPPAPRYAPDGGRKAAVITAPIVYGLGAMISGVSYLTNKASCNTGHLEYTTGTGYRRTYDNDCSDASAALIAYGAISAGVPSIPRWVVGDAGRAVAYTAARGASIAAAAFIDWGDSDDSWMGPFLFGFAAPVTLAVVDMATTPHREDLEDPKDREPREAKKPEAARVTHIAPVAVADREGRSRGAAVTLGGTF